VTLITAHKILISSAIALFVVYALFELRNFTSGDGGALWRALGSAAGAAGFGIYLRSVFRSARSEGKR
jgi:hypothetical protein